MSNVLLLTPADPPERAQELGLEEVTLCQLDPGRRHPALRRMGLPTSETVVISTPNLLAYIQDDPQVCQHLLSLVADEPTSVTAESPQVPLATRADIRNRLAFLRSRMEIRS